MTAVAISILQGIEGVSRIILGLALAGAVLGALIGTVIGILVAMFAIASGTLPK